MRAIKTRLDGSLDPLLHASALADETVAAHHRRFIATHLGSGIAAFALIPLCLVFQGGIAAFTATALALLGLEALVAMHVSRTGDLKAGYVLSALLLTGLVAFVAGFTGGLASFAVVWFAIAPIEAALSGDRKVIQRAAAIGASGFALLAALHVGAALPMPLQVPGGPALMNAVAGLVALVYAAGLALRVETNRSDDSRRVDAAQSRYHLLADAMTDMVTCHGADGDTTFISPAAERLLGASPAELMGDGLFRRVHVADRPAYLSALSAGIHQGAASVEYRLRRGDLDAPESWVWVEALIRRQNESGGGVVAVTRDITRHKGLEGDLTRARQDAEAASLAKTRFLANMSHELRTPLNAIIGFSDILTQEIFGKFEFERHREYTRLIKESGEHLLQVVNDILDMSKIEAGSFDVMPEPFDIGQVIDRCRQIMTPQAEQAGVTIVGDIESGLPELCADRRACRQILLNLLSNAVKFSKAGGNVVCGARREGRQIAIFVRDSGIGISAEDLPRLGQPFVQAENGYDRRAEGTGLGLSVVKGLAALHGGSMAIESRLGNGTTVTVFLPITAAATHRGDAGPAAPVNLNQRRA